MTQFQSEDEAKNYVAQNGGSYRYVENQQQGGNSDMINFLYEMTQLNPGNKQIGNAYLQALYEQYDPTAQLEQQQAEREQAMKEVELLGSMEGVPEAESAVRSILARYYPEFGTSEVAPQTAEDIQRQGFANMLKQRTADTSLNMTDPNQAQEIQFLQNMSNASPSMLSKYNAPVTFSERGNAMRTAQGMPAIGLAGALGNLPKLFSFFDNDSIRRSRL